MRILVSGKTYSRINETPIVEYRKRRICRSDICSTGEVRDVFPFLAGTVAAMGQDCGDEITGRCVLTGPNKEEIQTVDWTMKRLGNDLVVYIYLPQVGDLIKALH